MNDFVSYLEKAKAAGSFDSLGAFTLDGAEARETYAHYLHPTTSSYLQKLCQFAHLSNTERVHFEITPSSVHLTFINSNSTADTSQLQQAFLDPMSVSRQPATNTLIEGLLGIAALRPKRATLSDQTGQSLCLLTGELSQPPSSPPKNAALQALQLKILRRRDPIQARAERANLQNNCCFGPSALYFGSRRITPKLRGSTTPGLHESFVLAEARALAAEASLVVPSPSSFQPVRGLETLISHQTGEGEQTRLKRWLQIRACSAPDKVHFVRHGVIVETWVGEWGRPGLQAYVDASDFPTDLGGFGLQEGEELTRLRAVVEEESTALCDAAQKQLPNLQATVAFSQELQKNRNLPAAGTATPVSLGLASAASQMVSTVSGLDLLVGAIVLTVSLPTTFSLFRKVFQKGMGTSEETWDELDYCLRAMVREQLNQWKPKKTPAI